MQTKHKWRTEMKDRLKELSEDEKSKYDHQLLEQLFTYEPYKSANTIGLTIAMKNEVDTRKIIEHAWSVGKKVAVPKCHPEDKTMTFRYLTSWNELETVYFGLQEPKPEVTEECSPEEIQLLIVPGLLFDERGYRIGFGGGYYDRFLQHYHNSTVSLAYDIQLVKELPVEPFDLPVGALITDKKILSFT
ncbi:5-formyltetrahydrofolate cyclo-ligase [Guptibacillus algicola]|uniref:5-formyltetrahydrofolate cyclo-ligase n=1 Tax=Guptibacillus algicola TaxID=225844 RepID=UPI001CD1D3AF|nr:5-formyltetrahydrofolate cyclo-ligase [Alkalihalobacillus algicola]MCA0986040.1 5-formyltetrahydrofolate cyclo-ligase [Alkalihalobacillus algicola]